MSNGNYDEESAKDQPIVEELAGDTTAEAEMGVEATGVGSGEATGEAGGKAVGEADGEDETRDAAELQEELAEELDALIEPRPASCAGLHTTALFSAGINGAAQ